MTGLQVELSGSLYSVLDGIFFLSLLLFLIKAALTSMDLFMIVFAMALFTLRLILTFSGLQSIVQFKFSMV